VQIAKSRGILTMIDNTFATPINQRPIEWGVDVVVHSATKFLGGHGDAIGGVVAGPADFIERVLKGSIRHYGGCLSPFNAWLIARGVATLPLRMARHNANALAVAEWLEAHPAVAWVRYPWLPSHPQVELARRQMPGGGGGVVVFELKGSLEAGARLQDRVQLCARTVSLGDVRQPHHPPGEHHASQRGARGGAGGGDYGWVVRFAVGIEDVEVLWQIWSRRWGSEER
jgi:cystathionine beta-lyase/cystathionine gamma-synthase